MLKFLDFTPTFFEHFKSNSYKSIWLFWMSIACNFLHYNFKCILNFKVAVHLLRSYTIFDLKKIKCYILLFSRPQSNCKFPHSTPQQNHFKHSSPLIIRRPTSAIMSNLACTLNCCVCLAVGRWSPAANRGAW